MSDVKWKLVPVEPTPEMLEAAKPFPKHLRSEHPDPHDPWHAAMAGAALADQMSAATTYRDMLAASPASPPAEALPSQTSGAGDGGEAAIRAALAPWWKQVCEFTKMPGIPASVAGDELVAIVLALAKPASEPAGGGVREALRDLLDHVDRETCVHEETHRGGFIWTICDQCGRKWADDEGGFVPYSDPPAVARARVVCEAVSSSPASSSPAEAEALQAGVEAWKRQDGGLNADWVAMVLSDDARIEDGKLANPSYLAVKIADAADMPAEVARLRKAIGHIRDHTRETTTATMAIGALSSAPAQEDGSDV
ncbi:MAG: hypothetical protein J0I42_15215 [Bosea sp.]|uniref:hypothetical protein n=1 Tax=Bosea sp. (in: a-proteobacteria) TaxID=1871050 RepID=UPI001AC96FA6|nr:hypothetical protein [Bosea sp. (in: a-proteobacteria)]MBN9453297.1 hypothetical protein [Bosea sp. (in: a-proteobacteria)]